MAKGNQLINKSLAKNVENGHIVQELPEVEFEGKMHSISTPISPTYRTFRTSRLAFNRIYSCLWVVRHSQLHSGQSNDLHPFLLQFFQPHLISLVLFSVGTDCFEVVSVIYSNLISPCLLCFVDLSGLL